MALPYATTTIDVISVTGDPYEPQTETTVFTEVRAHFSGPSGTGQILGGEQAITDMELLTDPIDLQYNHVVIDRTSNERWSVEWAVMRRAVGLDHCHAGVNRVVGATA